VGIEGCAKPARQIVKYIGAGGRSGQHKREGDAQQANRDHVQNLSPFAATRK
jgi:hypothetical protein